MTSFLEFCLTLPGFVSLAGIGLLISLSMMRKPMLCAGFEDPLTPDEFMRILVSLLVLGSSLWVILSGQYEQATQKWAFGAAGTVLGTWLPQSREPPYTRRPSREESDA